MSWDADQQARNEAHVYSAYAAAFARWDDVTSEVSASTDLPEALERLGRLLDLDEAQAHAVLSLQVRRLTRTDRTMIAERLGELREQVARADPDATPPPPQRPAALDLLDSDPKSLRRSDFRVTRELPTRWSDDDTYGHVNNVVHYLMFDTAVNGWLIEASGTDIRALDAIGLVVETGCRYFAELRFPETVTAGIALERLGTSSVVYRIALFGERSQEPAAAGRFVHVYVDRESRRPVPVPAGIRTALAALGIPG